MGHGYPHGLHAGDHGGGWRRPRSHRLDGVIEPQFQGRIGVVEHVEHYGGGAKMRHPVFQQRLIDGARLHMAQADAHPGGGRQCPGEAPAVAVEHRQGPQIDGVLGQLPGEHVVDRIEVGAAMVIDHPLGVARGARGVVQGNRLPLVRRQPAGLVAVAPGNKALVGRARPPAPPPDRGDRRWRSPEAGSQCERAPCAPGHQTPCPPAPPCSGHAGR